MVRSDARDLEPTAAGAEATSANEPPDARGGLQAVPERAGLPRALQLFATGALGGVLTIFGLGVLALPTTHHCCGASADQRAADADTRRRCMELGVTPEELAALDAAAAPATVVRRSETRAGLAGQAPGPSTDGQPSPRGRRADRGGRSTPTIGED